MTQGVAEEFSHFSFDVSRSVSQDVFKRLMFSVEVSEEVLGWFGEMEDGLQIDDFRGHAGDGGKISCQQFQVFHVSVIGDRLRFVGIWIHQGV